MRHNSFKNGPDLSRESTNSIPSSRRKVIAGPDALPTVLVGHMTTAMHFNYFINYSFGALAMSTLADIHTTKILTSGPSPRI